MELQVTTRTVLGRGVRALRASGLIPAEVYGHGIQNMHLSVPAREFEKVFRVAGEHTIVILAIDGGTKLPVIIADAMHDPISRSFRSIDFHAVRMDERIQAKIPVHSVGTAPAQKLGFPIVSILQEIEVEALPAHLPHSYDVDVSPLETPGQSIYVRDLAIAKDVKILLPPDTVLVTVGEKTKEEAPPPAPTAAPETPEAGAVTEEKTEGVTEKQTKEK